MREQNTMDLLDAVASALATARNDYPHGIPVGDGDVSEIPHVDHIAYQEGDKQIWLRLTNGEAWLLRVHQLGSKVYHEDPIGQQEVVSSYCRYKSLHRNYLLVIKTVESAGLDTEMIAQTYHDDILGDDERADWNRWQSGGYATAAEWEIINQLIEAGTLTC